MDRIAMPLYRRSGSPFWWVRIGRKTRESTGTKDRAEAKEYEERLRERLWRRNKLGDRGAIAWKEVAKRWLADSKRTRKRDREILKWLDGEIGEESVENVADPDALEALRQSALAEGWSHSTVDRFMRTVRAVLRKCVEWRYLESVPKVPMYGETETEPRWLTPEEFQTLVHELPPHLKVAARFAVLTLLRMRSQSRLTWDRVDLKAKRAWIPRAQMKGQQRTHAVDLSGEAVKVLEEARALSPTGDRVFQYEGNPIDDFNTAAFKKAVTRAKVAPLRWHDLRHTGASWAVQNGVTLPELMVLGGWKSYAMVLKYAHLAPANATSAVEKVAQRAHTAKTRIHRKTVKTQ
jgi:integrase